MCAISSSAHAAITFTVLKAGGNTPIQLGSTVAFSIFIAPDTGTISNLAGVDVRASADDPALLGTITTGGRFISATSDLFPANANGWAATFPGSVAAFGANNTINGAPISAFNAQRLLGTVTLSTVGAVLGNHELRLSGLLVVDLAGSSTSIGVTSQPVNLNYSIVAVPEPSSFALLGLLGSTALTRFWYKRQKGRRIVLATNCNLSNSG